MSPALQAVCGQLALVDLAGSERVTRTKSSGDRLDEALGINSSLTALGTVMLALINKAAHVPYRNSLLTHMLQPGMKKGCRVAIVVTVSPDNADAAETAVALGFGTRARQAKLGPAQSASANGMQKKFAEAIKQSRANAARESEGKLRELELQAQRAGARVQELEASSSETKRRAHAAEAKLDVANAEQRKLEQQLRELQARETHEAEWARRRAEPREGSLAALTPSPREATDATDATDAMLTDTMRGELEAALQEAEARSEEAEARASAAEAKLSVLSSPSYQPSPAAGSRLESRLTCPRRPSSIGETHEPRRKLAKPSCIPTPSRTVAEKAAEKAPLREPNRKSLQNYNVKSLLSSASTSELPRRTGGVRPSSVHAGLRQSSSLAVLPAKQSMRDRGGAPMWKS